MGFSSYAMLWSSFNIYIYIYRSSPFGMPTQSGHTFKENNGIGDQLANRAIRKGSFTCTCR